jgi:hypothetical protein
VEPFGVAVIFKDEMGLAVLERRLESRAVGLRRLASREPLDRP